ncbi:hypothetical protein AWB95_16655 [Mycobacterium celatum]|uniref:Uncharacterized protein n=1 Tax=Mycobacterium celatum TaxID=28045 RepID=A0A1X1RMK7_MYCCE|nr:hypothetical protein [Mycobacterium celatum]ORV09859.1 hypothetical protein AWB95_16655 [Mycobacterium celatum]PIB79668.1 hypothetical protein CQY23_07065 [Mycobacterium celatum]
MADADLVITGTVLTVDDARPTAEALNPRMRNDAKPRDGNDIADLDVRATFLAGRQVYGE